MTLIDREHGERPVCDRCHRVRVRIRRGAVCEDCREKNRQAYRRAKAMLEQVRAYQRELREGA